MLCSVYIAASVDGFIAKPDGDVQWLHNPAYDVEGGVDFGYKEFIQAVDTLVMGRLSFEKVLTFGSWPYENLPVVVLTSREIEVPRGLRDKVRLENGSPTAVTARLAARGSRHLYIDGGETIRRFLRAGLINRLIITQIPILLGDGISLFASLGVEVPLKHLQTRSYSNGFVQTTYQVR